jgi:hypothetical protein
MFCLRAKAETALLSRRRVTCVDWKSRRPYGRVFSAKDVHILQEIYVMLVLDVRLPREQVVRVHLDGAHLTGRCQSLEEVRKLQEVVRLTGILLCRRFLAANAEVFACFLFDGHCRGHRRRVDISLPCLAALAATVAFKEVLPQIVPPVDQVEMNEQLVRFSEDIFAAQATPEIMTSETELVRERVEGSINHSLGVVFFDEAFLDRG